jgi:CelD/BcsL family acetyltransferase involved in cellulose biosynthesis
LSRIDVNICPPDLSIGEHWDDLARRASVNVFLHPAALNSVYATGFAKVHVLLAWEKGEPDRLVGLWAVQNRSTTALRPAVLATPPYDYAFVSNPMVDPSFMDEVIPAFLDAIQHSPALPNLIRLKYLDGECGTYDAIRNALTLRGSPTLKLAERGRPFASRDFGRKSSGSTRKKLRQDWNRLSAQGAVDIVNDRTRCRVRDAFELFLAMEARSWKGARGTALLCSEKDAAFARKLVWDLATQDCASVALLRLAGEPIAAQVLLYGSNTAYTWKTTFNPDYAKYSPGALLVDRVTDELFANPAIESIESCSPEGGFMSQIWEGRRKTVDLLVDVRAEKHLSFAMAATWERGHAQLRGLRARFRSASSAARKRAFDQAAAIIGFVGIFPNT